MPNDELKDQRCKELIVILWNILSAVCRYVTQGSRQSLKESNQVDGLYFLIFTNIFTHFAFTAFCVCHRSYVEVRGLLSGIDLFFRLRES